MSNGIENGLGHGAGSSASHANPPHRSRGVERNRAKLKEGSPEYKIVILYSVGDLDEVGVDVPENGAFRVAAP